MPKEIIDNLPMPLSVLEVYGTPWILIQSLYKGNHK